MGFFGKSSYEKYKPIYNWWLHQRKIAYDSGHSISKAEEIADRDTIDYFKISYDVLYKTKREGISNNWGAERLKNLNIP